MSKLKLRYYSSRNPLSPHTGHHHITTAFTITSMGPEKHLGPRFFYFFFFTTTMTAASTGPETCLGLCFLFYFICYHHSCECRARQASRALFFLFYYNNDNLNCEYRARDASQALIIYYFTITTAARERLYPHSWHTSINWHLECSCEAFIQTYALFLFFRSFRSFLSLSCTFWIHFSALYSTFNYLEQLFSSFLIQIDPKKWKEAKKR